MKKFLAFTLVELIVVIAIISILAGAVITVVDPASNKKKARDAVRKSDLAVISSAIENYYADNKEYPNSTSLNCLYGILAGSSGNLVPGCTVPGANRAYLKVKPADPLVGNAYCYQRVTAQNYTLCAKLEVGAEELHGVVTPCTPATPTAAPGGLYCLTNPF